MANFIDMTTGANPPVDLIQDGWTEMFAVDVKKEPESEEEAAELKALDFQLMDTVRQRISDTVEDPDTAEALKPWYGVSCKRPCYHDDYLPAFNRDNVTLVDTDGLGVTEHHREGHRRRRHRVRGRLHRLRHRLRLAEHLLHAPPRLRSDRQERRLDVRGSGPRGRGRSTASGPTASRTWP